MLHSFKGDGSLGIKIFWKEHFYYVINVYSSCVLNNTIELWSKLLKLKDILRDREWITGGDCNVVKHQSERNERCLNVNNIELNHFADFIVTSELVDIPCKGK